MRLGAQVTMPLEVAEYAWRITGIFLRYNSLGENPMVGLVAAAKLSRERRYSLARESVSSG